MKTGPFLLIPIVIAIVLAALSAMLGCNVGATLGGSGVSLGAGASTTRQEDDTTAEDFDTLVNWMIGSFSSANQADSDTNFYDIRLHMVLIWPERVDGVWLYVEQAAASNLDRPYRQRVYRLTAPTPGTFVSDIYTFSDPLRFAGGWQKAAPLALLTPDSLTIRDGCAVWLERRRDGTFAGATRGDGCASNLRGASYATSEVVITATGIESWDRGWDERGNQVWGATDSAYRFERSD
jgi:hypothetical protein